MFHVGGMSRSQPSAPPAIAAATAGTMLYWYRARDARPQGPLRMERLRELWLQGGLDAHSLIWCEAWPHWKPVCLVPELADVKPPPRPSRTPPLGFSLVAEEQAWLRQMQEVRARVRRVAPAGALDEDTRPTREMPSVASAASLRSRRGRALLAGALVGPALLGVCLSAVLLVVHPRVPEGVLSLVRCLFLWAEGNAVDARPPRAPAVDMPAPEVRAVEPVKQDAVVPARGRGQVRFVSEVRTERARGTGSPQCRGEVPVAMSVSDSLEERLDKDFERELGFAPDSPPRPSSALVRPTRTVYVPPEPAGTRRESLSASDIVQGVIAHKQAVLACIRKHAPERARGEEKSRMVMSWRVLPEGTVTDVAVVDAALQGSPLAGCLEEQVRSWTFPQHRVASQTPVRFPFVY